MTSLTMRERAANYARAFPDRPASWPAVVTIDGRECLQAIWQFGQDFRNRSDYYGAYPGDFLPRLSAVFPEHTILPDRLPFDADTRTLHAFSGSLPVGPYERCDVVQTAEYHCDVRALPDVMAARGDDPFDFVAADPPYSDEDAVIKYKAPPLDRGALTRALARATNVGGYMAWLDTVWPMHNKHEWVTVGMIAVVRSTNHRIRMLTLFERVHHHDDERTEGIA